MTTVLAVTLAALAAWLAVHRRRPRRGAWVQITALRPWAIRETGRARG